MIITYDVENYKQNKKTQEYEPVLDATGKNFTLGCVYKETGGRKIFETPQEMWKYIIALGKKELARGKKLTCYAHNARYDFYQIADLKDKNLRFFSETPFIASYYMTTERSFDTKEEFKRWKWYADKERIEYKIKIEMGDITIIEYKKEAIKFLDTMAIFRMSLKKVGEIIGYEKEEMPLIIGKRMTKKKRTEIAKYCMRDCKVTMKAIEYLKEKLGEEELGIRNLCTINQIAISYVLNKLRKNKATQILYTNKAGEVTDMTWKTEHKEKVHSAYRGGYVRAWNTGFYENVTSIDFNSLYAYSAITMKFPNLRKEWLIKEPLKKMKKEELLGQIGISRAMIKNRTNDIGFLPIRLAEKSYSPKRGKIMIGTWTNKELEIAEKEGYEIIDIEWSVLWEEAENPLEPIYKEAYEKRLKEKKFGNWFYKAMMNSSIGKFGQRRTDQMIVIDSIEEVYNYAEKMFKYSLSNEEILKNDMTIKLLKELEREVKNKEIISGQINAKPRLAKSTTALLLGIFIHGLLKKYGYKEKEANFNMDNIARDQGERAKKMREPERMYDIIVTDESNALEETGENSTVERAQREVFSDVQAGRYIHGIFVCPEGTMDKNTDWKLEIRNKAEGLVHCRLYYFMKSSMYYGWVMIGVVNLDVKELIKNWKNVEPRFMKYLKKGEEKDKKYIEYWSKRDFYVEYMVKKYEKMELMNREGIMHARDLDYAKIRYAVVTSLKPLAELQFITLNRIKNNIKAKVETEFKRYRMPLSILGREQEAERVMAYLGMYRSLQEIRWNMRNIQQRYAKGKIEEGEYEDAMKVMMNARKEIEGEIEANEKYLQRMVKLQEKYNEFKK